MASQDIYILAAVVATIVAIITLAMQMRNARDKRIASETKVADALDKNSEVTSELTGVVKGILDTQQQHTVELAKLDVRVGTLENQPHVSVNVGHSSSSD